MVEPSPEHSPTSRSQIKPSGSKQAHACWNTQGIFRLIQSIPSPKAQPCKRWLAKVGKERLDEIENPKLAMGRRQELYEKKGYPKEWIDKRLRGIAVRQDLTDEWKQRGVSNSQEFAILTNEIMHGSITPVSDTCSSHAIFKQELFVLRERFHVCSVHRESVALQI